MLKGMLPMTLYCLFIVRYSISRHYLIEAPEEEFSGMGPANESPSESLNNRYCMVI